MKAAPQSRLGNPVGLVVALLLLGVVAISSFVSWQQYVKYANRTHDANTTLLALRRSVIGLQLAETAARAYALTSAPRYLRKYEAGVAESKAGLRDLTLLAPEIRDPRLVARLTVAIDEDLAQLQISNDSVPGDSRDSDRQIGATLAVLSLASEYNDSLQKSLTGFRSESRFFARLSQWVSTLGCAGIFLIVLQSSRANARLLSRTAKLNLELTQANADLEQFVYSASHDLGEPLRTISLYTQLIERNCQGLEFELKHLQAATRLMMEIVKDLISYTQALNDGSEEEESADLAVVLASVRDGLAAAIADAGAQIDWPLPAAIPISAVHARILFQNLIGNAIKYRRPGEVPRITIRADRGKSDWLISVADNGIGIAPEYQQQIFGVFRRLHSRATYEGTGLGLAICKKIVDRYHGEIGVQSELGKGSLFFVRLPGQRADSPQDQNNL